MKNNWVSKLTVIMMASVLLAGSAVAVPSASANVAGGGTPDVISPVDDASTGSDTVVLEEEQMYPDVNAEEDTSGEQPSDSIFTGDRLFPGGPIHKGPGGDVLDATSTTATQSTRDKMANLAVSKIGSKYVWGAAGPNTFDCSGFTMWIYKQYGYSLPHSSSSQSNLGTAVSISNLVKGDLLFYGTGSVSHVAMYIGDGYMVHAENENTGVVKTSINNSWYKAHFIKARHFNIN